MTWRDLLVKDEATCGGKYPIPPGGCTIWQKLPIIDTEAKYGLKCIDVSIKLSEYINVLRWKLAIIAVGMPYDFSF